LAVIKTRLFSRKIHSKSLELDIAALDGEVNAFLAGLATSAVADVRSVVNKIGFYTVYMVTVIYQE
jgi:hypothetical protein